MQFSQYAIDVEHDQATGNAAKITWQHTPSANTTDTHPGVYCLRTNQREWDEETLWKTYTMLTDLEAVFRSLKSELDLRPVYHQLDDRISGHLFITVLAYHLVHTVRYKLKQAGLDLCWESLRKLFSSQVRLSVSMLCKNGSTVHIRKSTRPEPDLQAIYTALEVKPHPGPVIKTTI